MQVQKFRQVLQELITLVKSEPSILTEYSTDLFFISSIVNYMVSDETLSMYMKFIAADASKLGEHDLDYFANNEALCHWLEQVLGHDKTERVIKVTLCTQSPVFTQQLWTCIDEMVNLSCSN